MNYGLTSVRWQRDKENMQLSSNATMWLIIYRVNSTVDTVGSAMTLVYQPEAATDTVYSGDVMSSVTHTTIKIHKHVQIDSVQTELEDIFELDD